MTHPHFPPLTSSRAATLFADETGAATAEYAVATMAAVEHSRHTRGSASYLRTNEVGVARATNDADASLGSHARGRS